MREKVPGLATAVIEKDLNFSIEEYQQRQANVRTIMQARDIDVLVVNTPENMYYLSGYNTPGYYTEQCLVLPLDGEPIILCRATEEMNVRATSCLERSDSYVDDQAPVEVFVGTLRDEGFARARIGVEKKSWFLTVETYEGLKEGLPDATIANGSMIVEECRMVKSEAEIACIRRAADIVSVGMKAAVDMIEPGVNEDHVAAEFNKVVTAMGSEWPGLPPFVVSGKRSSFTHATYAGRVMADGDPILLELPAVVKRYGAALMRTVFAGTPPAEIQRRVDTGRRALERHLKTVRAGRTPDEVWRVWANTLAEDGDAETYRRAGYSIGINYPPDWGEGYIIDIRRGEHRELQTNMTFHVPSLVKRFGLANVGPSETIRVTDDGCEVLTSYEDSIRI